MKYMKICSLLAVLLLLGAGSADAQQCFTQVMGTANTVRAEGLTEVVSSVQVLCRKPALNTGDNPFVTDAVPESFKLAIELNTRITNTIGDTRVVQWATPSTATVADNTYVDGGITVSGSQLVTNGATPPVGIIDTGGTPTVITNSRFGMGKLSDDGTTIEWTLAREDDDTADDVGGVANKGVNLGAATLTGGGQNGFGFVMTISGIRANAYMVGDGEDIVANVTVGGVAVNAAPVKLSDVTTGLDVAVKAGSGLQCNKDSATSDITLTEGFASAFMAMGSMLDDDTTTGAGQIESMMAYSDTFLVTFTGVPDGVKVTVPNTVPLVDDDEDTANVDEEALSLALMRVTGRTSGADNAGVVDLSAAGAGQVMYKIMTTDQVAADTGANPPVEAVASGSTVDNTKKESVKFSVTFSWDKGAPAIGEAWVFVSYHPTSSDGGDTFAVGGAAVPRFMEDASGDGVVEVKDCMTTLFYPFVTSASGYDTGIVVSNTSGGAGDCSAAYSGSEESMDLGEVMAGSQSVFLVSSHMMDFSGYLEVSCDTESASGFAHVVDTSGFSGSQGYIAQCSGGCK